MSLLVSCRAIAAALMIAATVGGCAGATDGTVLLATGSAPVAASAATLPDVSSQPKPVETFDPFRDVTHGSAGGREVIADPSLEEVLKPGPLPELAVGRADAPVVVVKYMSLTCPFCRQFQLSSYPEIKRRYIDTGKVRFIFREFPIGMQSGQATIALRCAKTERYVELYERFMAGQAQWVSQDVRLEPIARLAAQSGVTRAAFDACRQDATLVEALKAVKDRGRALGIVGTPNFFVNRRLVKTVLDAKVLSELIEQELGSTPGAVAGGP
jgi:protein-disulfide isomerase